MIQRRKLVLGLVAVDILVTLGVVIWVVFILKPFDAPRGFDSQLAFKDAAFQMSLGPRTPGSSSHQQVIVWIKGELTRAGWDVSDQITQRMGHPIDNIVAKRGKGSPWIILGAHYDSRLHADQDKNPDLQLQPVPGADDGASGVAVLIELARSLPKNLDKEVWLVFFDAEDQGDFPGWDWLQGSRAFAESLAGSPQAVVVVDMIGDRDLNIYYERNSESAIMHSIWDEAAASGFKQQFIPALRWSMEDDHTPFIQKGIPAVDIIDFNYPYWHTTADTLDKISADSLNAVGTTLYQWVLNTKGDWQK